MIRIYIKKALLIIFTTAALPISTALQAQAKSTEIIVWDRLANNPVVYQVLQMALDKTRAEYGAYHLTLSRPMEQGRVMIELTKNKSVHLANFAPTSERETKLLPIRIPVTKGLLGYRVCLIRKGTEFKFKGIHSIYDWKKQGLRIGQGTHWPDTAVLEGNNLKVEKSVKYTPLFEMLAKGRFDCFSRSVSEVLPELEKHRAEGITLDNKLALVYRLPSFFFVSRQNPQLAQRLQKGLKSILADGSFDSFITSSYGPQLKILGMKQRQPIYLDNPYLSKETKEITKDPTLWLDPFGKSR